MKKYKGVKYKASGIRNTDTVIIPLESGLKQKVYIHKGLGTKHKGQNPNN